MLGQRELFDLPNEGCPNNAYARAKGIHFTTDDKHPEPISPNQKTFDFEQARPVVRLPYKDD